MTEVRLITSNLIDEIKDLTRKADHLYWIVAFAMKSGVRLVLPYLKEAAENGAEIKILIGDYLHITQPEALELCLQNCRMRKYVYITAKGCLFIRKLIYFVKESKVMLL